MNRKERFDYILKLERELLDERVRAEIAEAKRKNHQDLINFTVNLIAEQNKAAVMGLFLNGMKK